MNKKYSAWAALLAGVMAISNPVVADELIFPVGSKHVEYPSKKRNESNYGIGYGSDKYNLRIIAYRNSRIFADSWSLAVTKRKTFKVPYLGNVFIDYGGVYYDNAKKTKDGREGRYKPYIKPVALLGVKKDIGDGFFVETAVTWKLIVFQFGYEF